MAQNNKTLSLLAGSRAGSRAVNVLRLAADVADTETVTIGSDVYEFDADATYTAGRIPVDVSGGLTPTVASAALVAAINARANGVLALAISVNEILIWSTGAQQVLTACTETLAGSNNVWAAAAMYGGAPKDIKKFVAVSRVPTATEVTIGNLHFHFDFTPAIVIPQVRVTATGIAKAWDGGYTISGGRLTLNNAGSTDWAATDTVSVLVFEGN